MEGLREGLLEENEENNLQQSDLKDNSSATLQFEQKEAVIERNEDVFAKDKASRALLISLSALTLVPRLHILEIESNDSLFRRIGCIWRSAVEDASLSSCERHSALCSTFGNHWSQCCRFPICIASRESTFSHGTHR